mmetsp:Transcript_46/g.70  ORF Transcript_46/g.70 Transcript_46/m.70 type:complete len:241 (+) Transcript_46:306-1028(+)
MEVSTPSATSVVEDKIWDIVSPSPNRYPKRRFLDKGPKHVPKVSPTPDNPAIVLGLASKTLPNRLISAQPLVTNPLMALVPSPNPSHIPAAKAITFLTAPPISTPITSFDVNTRKLSSDIKLARSSANKRSDEAMTTAVATPSQISRAKLGPLKNAYPRSSPKTSLKISAMKPKLVVSIPLLALKIGVPGGINSFTLSKNARLNCTGTAWIMYVASASAALGSVVARILFGRLMSLMYRG